MGVVQKIERKIEMSFLQKILAEAIERIFKNKVTSIIGLLVIAGGAITGASNVISPDLVFHTVHVKAALIMIESIIGGVVLLLAKDAGVKLNPNDYGQKAPIILAILALGLIAAPRARAQAEPLPDPLSNIYAAGVSYGVNATPAVSGTALYAKLLPIGSDGNTSKTYLFTAVDGVPNSLKPFTVTTNIGAGIAQKIVTIGKVPVFMPTAAGISWSGTNTGWQWNGGALAAIHIKGAYYVMPTVRFLKSSVSNGTGYQPIVGLLFGWGN